VAAKTNTLQSGKQSEQTIQTIVVVIGVVIFILLMALIVYPSWTLIKTSFTADKQFTINNYVEQLTQKSTYTVLRNSLFVSLLGSVGATVIGVLVAWLLARTDVPAKRLWQTLLIVPYLIPPFIGAIAWVYLLGPVGFINKFWMAISGSLNPLFVIYGKWGIVFVMAIYSYPIAYMVNLGPLRQMNPSLEEAARISGANFVTAFKDFEVPLWVIAASAGAIAFGTSVGGWSLIKTLGARFFRIRPVHGFCTQAASASVILGAALLGGPVSTTQVVSSTIMGVGSADRVSKVHWGVAGNILLAWLLTIPLSGLVGALIYFLLSRILPR